MLATATAFQPQNMIEKIAQRYAVDLAPNQTILSGDFVAIRPEHVLTHDNTGAVISKYVLGTCIRSGPLFLVEDDLIFSYGAKENLQCYIDVVPE